MTRSQSLTSNYICLIQIHQEADCCIDLLPREQIWLSKGQLIPSRRKSLILLSLLWICSSNKQFCPVSDFWNASRLVRSRNSSLMASRKYGAACDGGAKRTLGLVISVSPGDVRGRTSPQGGRGCRRCRSRSFFGRFRRRPWFCFASHLREAAAAFFGPDSRVDAQNLETSLQTSEKTPGLRPCSSETFVASFRS